MVESYITVRGEGRGEYEEKKSRFLAVVRPVATEGEAKAMLEEVRAAHPDARHNVYAYLTDFSAVQRMSDDGEPQGTGGVQLMEPVQRKGYTNLCIVVTRYFGGTLLGAGPLARAYGKAARLALEDAGEAQYRLQARYEFRVPYALQKRAEFELNKKGALMEAPKFGEDVTLTFTVLLEEKEEIERFCIDLSAGRSCAVLVDESFRPVS
ncbi:MAG: YigZ family protein [Clostridia bacterium]|nr:YigZ family protein [Clostridia bacterium]